MNLVSGAGSANNNLLLGLWSEYDGLKGVDGPHVDSLINYNTFLVLCTCSGIIEPAGGLEHIVTALEKNTIGPVMPPDQIVALTVAEKYFLHCARYFLLNCPCETTWGDYSPVWQPNDGLSQARWNFWKEQWERVRNVQDVSQPLREGATRALTAMEEAERDIQWWRHDNGEG